MAYNSYLSYTPIGKTTTLRFNMYVMEYSQPHALSGAAQQSKLFKHFYPKSYTPGDITVIGRVVSQDDYNNLAVFIRGFHLNLMNAGGSSNASNGEQIPLMHLYIDGEGINIDGLILSFEAGAKRFNVAPQFTFDFTVIKDAHSKNSDMIPGYALRQMWTGNFVDEGSINNDSTVTSPVQTGGPSAALPTTSPGQDFINAFGTDPLANQFGG